MKEISPGIVADRGVRFGKPVIKGTRVPVDLVVGKLAGGMTIEEVMRNMISREKMSLMPYPTLQNLRVKKRSELPNDSFPG